MQTLKDVFKREDERLNLVNVSLCVAIVVAVVVLLFGIGELNFAFMGSTADPPPAVVQTEGE